MGSKMALAAYGAETSATRAALIDPPMGMVVIEVSNDRVTIAFSDGQRDSVPRTAVRALSHDESEMTAHWTGVPVVCSFATPIDSARMFGAFGDVDTDSRAFTFLV